MRSFIQFSVLDEISCGFAVFSDFLCGFSVSNRPLCPLVQYSVKSGNYDESEKHCGTVVLLVSSKQTTSTTATGTSPNKRFNEQKNSCARAF